MNTSEVSVHEFDVRGGADEALLQVAAHAIGDGQRDDERSDAGGDSEDGDGGDEADHFMAACAGLAAASTQIAGGDEELKAHKCRQ
jgi:hypothetical protein